MDSLFQSAILIAFIYLPLSVTVSVLNVLFVNFSEDIALSLSHQYAIYSRFHIENVTKYLLKFLTINDRVVSKLF